MKNNFSSSTPEEIASHMEEHYGVHVKHEVSCGDDLFLFKYSQIGADWTKEETHECRGTILRRSNGEWKIASRPFDKFFNLDEGYCPLHQKREFESRIQSCQLLEKVDGTCIQVWLDKNIWRASTLGTITPLCMSGLRNTFEDVFWEVSGLFSSHLDEQYTYLFELCTSNNQIVTKYNRDIVFLTGIRNKETGEYLSLDSEPAQLLTTIYSNSLRLPHHYDICDQNIIMMEDLWVWVEKHAKDHDRYGKNPEGFVIYSETGQPLAKCKNANYKMLHRFGGGDFKCSQGSVIDAMMAGNLDDVYHDLNDSVRSFSDRLHEHIADTLKQWKYDISQLAGEYPDRKSYALRVNEVVSEPRVRAFCFGNLELIQKGDSSIDERLEGWLSQNYKKFEKEWKEL